MGVSDEAWVEYRHTFVKYIPDELESGILYVSLEYSTMVHRCPCGCGEEVSTRLHPEGWSMIYDGAHISLWPSVGNWGFACRSHYWLRCGMVVRARMWTDEEIEASRHVRTRPLLPLLVEDVENDL